MKARNRGRRARWIRLAMSVGAVFGLHAVTGGSANAASFGPRPHPAAGIASAGGPSSASAIVLAGFTSQNYPLFFKISSDGRMLVTGGIALNMTCTSGAQFVVADGFAKVRIGARGGLRASYSVPSTSGQNGATYSGTDSLTGKLGPKHSELTGIWRLQVHISAPGGQNDLCDSGPVRFAVDT
jgi:hypothetical protein